MTLPKTASACLMLVCAASMAHAQGYPAKPIRFISPYPPGGAVDILARYLGQHLHEAVGQPVIVENRAGGSGIVGTAAVAKAPPDGYTILMGSSGPIAVNPSLFADLPYDTLRDLAPVTMVAIIPSILAVHPSIPVQSVKQLIAFAKSHPGKLNFSSSGNGGSGHLAGEMFNVMAGVRMTHIPYRGTGPSVIGLMTGEVSLSFENMLALLPYVKEGRVRGLAVTSAKRSQAAPDLPTVAESGLPGYAAGPWFSIWAPANTPKDIVTTLNREFVKILKRPDVVKRLSTDGGDVVTGTPEDLAEFTRTEIRSWARVVKEASIKAN
jgi:tripartite-type tricarboxylate transporter receptor subunit TctC